MMQIDIILPFVNIGTGSQHKMRKRAGIMNQIVIQIVLVGIVLAVFMFATADKINSRDVRQQVIEKQLALLIDSAVSGMSFEVLKGNVKGVIQEIEIEDGRVYVKIDGLRSARGYPYFSKYSVSVTEEESKFIVRIK